MKKILSLLLLTLFLATAGISEVGAQCAMCSANAEQGSQNGNTQTKGINSGVLYLLSLPFLLATGVGTIWYLKYRQRPGDNHILQ